MPLSQQNHSSPQTRGETLEFLSLWSQAPPKEDFIDLKSVEEATKDQWYPSKNWELSRTFGGYKPLGTLDVPLERDEREPWDQKKGGVLRHHQR